MALAAGNEGILLIAVFAMLIGFGAKAGMFPLHAWLPAAHPQRPPASAVLSGIIVKSRCAGSYPCGLLCCRRGFPAGNLGAGCVDGVDAADSLYGLAACVSGNRYLRKRLAYSTVSQIAHFIWFVAAYACRCDGALLIQYFMRLSSAPCF